MNNTSRVMSKRLKTDYEDEGKSVQLGGVGCVGTLGAAEIAIPTQSTLIYSRPCSLFLTQHGLIKFGRCHEA
jgi:hypothetical protein